jgi:serine/threonine protein kinase
MRPAEHLEGLTLANGWKVLHIITSPPYSTGGYFSVGYTVEHPSGRHAYLKALDFSKALQTPDPARELESMLRAYNFERDLLAKCNDRNLDRIVIPLADGVVTVPGNFGPLANVCYLIFELAKGSIRDEVTLFATFDLAWCLRSLHHTSVGLRQLHSIGVAHQDVKPSNILFFPRDGSKISDLGRASDSSTISPADAFQVPGDVGYAPPEQFYTLSDPRSFSDRCLADLYLLGSLIFFYFGNCSATQAIQSKIKGLSGINFTNTDFSNDLPIIRQAFQEALLDLEVLVRPLSRQLTPDIIQIVSQLCEPDPSRRGDPKTVGTQTPQYSLQRYISRLDLISKKAEFWLK